jgi:hypothetical protein
MNRFLFVVLLATSPLETTDPLHPTAHSLDRWKAAHVQALKKQGSPEYEIRNVAFFAGDVDPTDEGIGPDSAVVTERTTSGDACTIGMRELTLSWKKEDDQAVVEKERLMGADCCDLDHCEKRTAGGWMSHLVQVCAVSEGQEQRLVKLVDPKRGIGVAITTNSGPPPRKVRWKRADADSLCNLEIAKFDCEEKTPDGARFTCTTAFLHEHYYFVWRRKNGATYIERISGTLED